MVRVEWGVVLPVKRLGVAKSRLRGAVDAVPHERLALALAQDTVAAAVACPYVAEVLAVTDDPTVADALAALGARIAPDLPGAGLNAAFAYGASLLPGRPVAALAADLPALRPEELAAALRDATARSYVADAPGTGTVLLTAPVGVPLEPRFGPGSAAAHRRSGALPLPGDWPTLRRDVDTAADLAAATRLGLGPHTGAVASVQC
ncbi:2-phospho-L-lactate guanylyltransferase [Phytohabitans rumicis]|uniref:2-phospho-L-lactate guanylyltransferase n=1 Tax=Phytohabitans rumicis TaxID=1076125 RepID=UPI0031F0E863